MEHFVRGIGDESADGAYAGDERGGRADGRSVGEGGKSFFAQILDALRAGDGISSIRGRGQPRPRRRFGRVDWAAKAWGLPIPRRSYALATQTAFGVTRQIALLRGAKATTPPEAQHVKALLGTLADHVPIQGTIGNGEKALYSISDAPNLHSTSSREECRMFLACIAVFYYLYAPVALAGNVYGQRRVLQTITDSVSNDRIGDDLAPVIERQCRCGERGFVPVAAYLSPATTTCQATAS